MKDYPPGYETDAAIARRIYGNSIMRAIPPRYSQNALHLDDLMQRLADRESEVWISVMSLQRNEDDSVTRRAKPYPYIVTLPNTFLSSEPRPLPAAVCEVLLRSLDMDEELRRLEQERK